MFYQQHLIMILFMISEGYGQKGKSYFGRKEKCRNKNERRQVGGNSEGEKDSHFINFGFGHFSLSMLVWFLFSILSLSIFLPFDQSRANRTKDLAFEILINTIERQNFTCSIIFFFEYFMRWNHLRVGHVFFTFKWWNSFNATIV